MTTPMFKIGNRVRMTRTYNEVPVGTIGTVLQYKKFPAVNWDDFSGGHDATFDDGRTSVWGVDENWLELVTPATAPVTPAPADGKVWQILATMADDQTIGELRARLNN